MAHTGSRRAQKWAIFFFSRRTKILPPAKGPEKGPECGRMGVGSKIGRLGASERRNPKFTTPQIW